MIDIKNISKSFGAQKLFEFVNFKIGSKERIGLVGRNGHGKTTLLQIIMGRDNFDFGKIIVPKNYRIGFVEQKISFSKSTVLEEGIDGLIESEKHHHWKVKKILFGLGFSEFDMKENPNKFSSGFQIRLNLAKTLISKPNLLLLDEPTNYLDISSIRWIEKFLLNWSNELILVTHDRYFMDKIVTHIIGIHRKKIKKIKGGTGRFYDCIAKEEEIYEKTRVNDEKRKKLVLSFVERFRAKARLAGMVQSRIKAMKKKEKKEKLNKLKSLDFMFKSKSCGAKKILDIKNLAFKFKNQNSLFKHLNLSINSNDRICIVGKNGKGKTTLLKIIAKIFEPTNGKIIYNTNVSKGLFNKDSLDKLSDNFTIEEEILYSHNKVTRYEARTICATMMFEGDLALKKIGVLSGGEKSRVLLAKLIVTPINLLLLDEPTNHLDMYSCDALLTAIDNFEGAVIMITHNEMFLHSIAERMIIFEEDNAHIFEGCYKKFLDENGWKSEKKLHKTIIKKQFSKKEIKNIRSKIIKNKSKDINPIKKNIDITEKIIEKSEVELTKLNRELVFASQNSDGIRIQNLSKKINKHEKVIEAQFNKLETMYKLLDQIEKKFNLELLNLKC